MILQPFQARGLAAALLCALLSLAAAPLPAQTRSPAAVDHARLLAADREPENWMTWGRTYSEQRFSPLDQIDDANIGALGLAWYFDLNPTIFALSTARDIAQNVGTSIQHQFERMRLKSDVFVSKINTVGARVI
jgi:hypothetical protein